MKQFEDAIETGVARVKQGKPLTPKEEQLAREVADQAFAAYLELIVGPPGEYRDVPRPPPPPTDVRGGGRDR